jgi:xanthine dehydrogenase iron-sulfur cluster and FAD-binding subunit A
MIRFGEAFLSGDAVEFGMMSSTAAFEFVLNGNFVQKTGIAPQGTLLDYIRDRGLTGAKEGCAEEKKLTVNGVFGGRYSVCDIRASH